MKVISIKYADDKDITALTKGSLVTVTKDGVPVEDGIILAVHDILDTETPTATLVQHAHETASDTVPNMTGPAVITEE